MRIDPEARSRIAPTGSDRSRGGRTINSRVASPGGADVGKRWRGLDRISTITSIRCWVVVAALLAATASLPSCKNAKLPGEGSEAAQLYLKRCGQVHQAYSPSQMTAAMWATQVDLMQE